MTFFNQFLFQRHVIFNDTVVDNDKVIMAVAVRMCIHIRRLSMCSPACMTDPDMSMERMFLKNSFQISQTAFLLFDLDLSVFIHSDTGRVIASVFKTTEPVN